MKKINIIKESKEFDRIIHNNKPIKYKDYIIYIEYINDNNYHFGLSVGKKIGNAVTRNKVKRQLKSIIDKNIYKNGFNCIIIVGKGILSKSYEDMNNNYNIAIKDLNIIKEDNNEK
ncbi:MAG: ribonuclease P protein component [Bacilli bacterium]|nr:ribonuclease P protein component [Bacilli bacterium]